MLDDEIQEALRQQDLRIQELVRQMEETFVRGGAITMHQRPDGVWEKPLHSPKGLCTYREQDVSYVLYLETGGRPPEAKKRAKRK